MFGSLFTDTFSAVLVVDVIVMEKCNLINFSDRIDLVTRLTAVLEAPVIFEPWPPPSETAHAATLQDRTRTPRHALGGGLWVQLQQLCSIKSEEA